MDASYWAAAKFLPDHVASEHGAPQSSEPPAAAPSGGSAPPSAETIAIMRRDPHMSAEFELYERANDVLSCKLQGCKAVMEAGSNAAGLALSAEGAAGRGGGDASGAGAGAGAGGGAGGGGGVGGGGNPITQLTPATQHHLQP